ncbi:OLC1v1023465C1 [Oldenlandia corymbosa var. corymbosa]|uniref:OLC1v1023465C1 n=1 Tax=Oldenlandia corymbosa var. corymbosa TaxID=529605 RepID=A0AAV1C1P9_OLDCO|nr:OLC1v1023465C1 [Oldenlandia corymbosa var. corymbosa]
MFTEGLDESAINWIKQGSNVEKAQHRSPLRENYDNKYPIPRSPIGLGSTSSHILPPLKFHSGLLGPHNPVASSLDSSSEDNYGSDDYDDGYESESVASVPDELDGICPEEEGLDEAITSGSREQIHNQKSTAVLNHMRGTGNVGLRFGPKLNRGLSKEYLRIEVPESTRRYTDTELGFEDRIAAANRSSRLPDILQSHSAYATPVGDLGTPSAPPLMEVRPEGENSEIGSAYGQTSDVDDANKVLNIPRASSQECPSAKEVPLDQNEQFHKLEVKEREDNQGMILGQTEVTKDAWEAEPKVDSPYYDASDQNAWQSLIAYDACIRLCLNAWARGCPEAPEFLKDECLLLRNAFGLHKFLLQPHGMQSSERPRNKIKRDFPSQGKQIAGKIRLEVKKVRIIPRRKLKDTNSLRGTMYMQVGAEYVRHVSALVKSGINSLKLASSSLTCEESFSCLVQLKSSVEDNQDGLSSAISLHPGTGDYHDFFTDNQGDVVLLEVQDMKKNVQGRAVIPIASLTDNPTEKVKWWPIHHDDHECIGKVQLSINWTSTNDEPTHIKNAPIVETFAYNLLLEAAMRGNKFRARNLCLGGPWKWLLTEFAEYYGVSDSYTKLRYLSYVMNVATPTKDCIELVYKLLLPVIQERNDKRLTRQEKSILLNCETQVESLLADVFQNYKLLDENSPTGIADMSSPILESAAPSLGPAVQVYTLLHDILAEDAKIILRNYFQAAAMKRCRKHMLETDDFLSNCSEGLVMDSMTMSTAYLKMKNLCSNISMEIKADIKIHAEHVLPSSIDLPGITATVYSTELCKRLRSFLSAWPPSSPQTYVNELLKATSDFERNLESWNIRPVVGGVDSRDLYHGYIMVWIQDMQMNLLDQCKAEKVPWSGVSTNYSTSPFAEEMFENLKAMLHEYEVVISRWPQYTLILENAVANVERAIMKALEKQYNDILTPLKDSVPKKLGMQVQKLARRQSTALYSVPVQLGTFLNTLKRILDVLHCKIEDILKAWASYLPINGEKKSSFGEHMNGVTVLLRTKYKNYMQAIVLKLASNMQASRSTRLQRILEETKATDGEVEIRERMQMLSTELSDSISNLHEVFTSRIFVAICRGFWDKMGQVVLKFLEGRKENRIWYSGSYHALGILDDIFASQMQRLQGNALQEKDLEPPRSINEARSILCRDNTNGMESSTYLYF